MITPHFSVSQTETHVEIKVDAQYTKIDTENQPEIHIQDNEILFHSIPYFLRLTFDKNLINQGETVTFDSGTFIIRALKSIPGEQFQDLDDPEKLLVPPGDLDVCPSSAPKYGFGHMKFGVFERLQMDDVVDLEDPDGVEEKDRRDLRQLDENRSFDDSHYLADLYEDEVIQGLLKFLPTWSTGEKEADLSPVSDELSEEERNELAKLPVNKFIQPSSTDQKKLIYFGLVDILLAYAYDFRSTWGQHNVESGWTICKLSATLSWLDAFLDVRSVVRSFTRRSLCYPLYRSWQLSLRVREDVCQILKKGKGFILKCLLKVRELLADHYSHYVLNDLYLDDYCIWIQHIRNEIFIKLANDLSKVKMSKAEVGFDLEALEAAGAAALEESGNVISGKDEDKGNGEEDESDGEDDDSEEEDDDDDSEEEDSDGDEDSEDDSDSEEDDDYDDDDDDDNDSGKRPCCQTDSIESRIETLNIEEQRAV